MLGMETSRSARPSPMAEAREFAFGQTLPPAKPVALFQDLVASPALYEVPMPDERTTNVKRSFRMAHRAAPLCALALSVIACVREPEQKPWNPAIAATDSVPAHDTLTITSIVLGEARFINVYLPPQRLVPWGDPLPVLYMPDGGIDEDFPHVTRTVDSLIVHGIIKPVMVVGIPNTERRRDLTGPTSVGSDSAIAPHVGGSARFRQFIQDELIPAIEARYPTTPERGILGESLAGLFIVETFLDTPNLFRHYIALDPSVWWNRGRLIDSASVRIAAFDGSARTLYLASSREPSTAEGAARLAKLLGTAPSALKWRFLPRPDLEHATIFRALEAMAIEDAFRK